MAEVNFETVASVLVEQAIAQRSDLRPESRFEDLGCDDLDLLEIMMAFEERFDIEIDDDDFPKLETVQDAVEYLVKKAAQ